MVRPARVLAPLLIVAGLLSGHPAHAAGPTLELYGFLELNFGYDFDQNDPDWFDVSRPSKLPAYTNEFGHDGRTFASVRPTRVGLQGLYPVGDSDIHTRLEFDLFGSDQNVGQTAFRLRHASVEYGHFGAGLTWSPFMDSDVSPASLEFFGPAGIVSFRNVLLYWRPLTGSPRLTIALERPGASGDEGIYANRIDLQDVRLRFPWPDLTAEYRVERPWGHFKIAAVGRTIHIDDLDPQAQVPGKRLTGWGVSLSSNFRPRPGDVVHLQLVYGHGIENYVNDAPTDVAAETRYDRPAQPLDAQTLPVFGATLFLDHDWNTRWSTSAGYSLLDITNSNAQTPATFRRGHYALVNLVHTAAPGLKVGGEVQWTRRVNFSDGFRVNDLRLQLTVRFDFSTHWGAADGG